MARNRIIDLSQFNTVTDWNLVKGNVDAVIIRMGFRYSRNGYLCIDNKYVEHRKACERLGIPFSLYFFTEAISEAEAVQEADLVAYECRDFKGYSLPVFVDSEYIDGKGRADGLDKASRTAVLKAFCNRLQALGVPAGIYCSYSWSINNIDRSQLPFSFWIAKWSEEKPETEYLLWQKTNVGTVPGIQGRVDISEEVVRTDAVTRLIMRAISEEGYLEKRNGDSRYLYEKTDNPGSANYTKYGWEMHNLQPSNMDYPAPWCDAFVDWCFYKEFGLKTAKLMLCGNFDDYTVNSAAYYKAAGRWYTSGPKAGDQVFFKDSGGGICHTGIVTDVTATTVHTIEGNTSSAAGVVANGGCVRRKEYPLGYSRIAGYGRPRYDLAD